MSVKRISLQYLKGLCNTLSSSVNCQDDVLCLRCEVMVT